MVFTLTAAMLVGTPMTASAAGLVDLYSVQKPGMEAGQDVNTTGTGTVTNTETGSSILNDNEGRIKGIVLDRESVEAEKGINETLTAEIILDGDPNFASISGNDTDDEKKAEALRRLSGKIVWKLGRLDAKGAFVQDTSLSKTLGIKIDPGAEGKNVDRRTLTLIPKQGTAAGKEVYVQASINSSVYINKYGNVKEYDNDLGVVSALAKVSVKEYTTSLSWKWDAKNKTEYPDAQEPKPYVNHTIDLSKYLVRDPETANDTITWTVQSAVKSVATVTAAGEVTIKKAGESFTVYAMGERCGKLPWKVEKTDPGEPATGVELWTVGEGAKKITSALPVDVGADEKNEDKSIEIEARLFATKKVVLNSDNEPAKDETEANSAKKANGKYKVAKKSISENSVFIEASADDTTLITPQGKNSPVQTLEITDYVQWNSNKTGIADVVVNSSNDRRATITVSKDAQIGTAAITAKIPKKSVKANVKVSATLTGLEITNKETELYSGQTLQMTYERTPKGNKDTVKWEIEKVDNKPNPNAKINAKGVLTIQPTITATEEDGDAKIKVVLKSQKKGTREEKKADKVITVKQSSIDSITITETNPEAKKVAKVGLDNKNRVVQQLKTAGTTTLDIPVNARYTVDVTVGSEVNSESFTKEVAVNTLTYKNTKPKVAEITRSTDGKLTITPKAVGTAKITVSGIRATKNSNDKVVGKEINTSFNVKVSQPVTSVSLSKPEIVLAEKKSSDGTYKPLRISGLKATFNPKSVNKSAEKKIEKWEIKKDNNYSTIPRSKNSTENYTNTTLSYNLIDSPKAGDVYTVKVTTATGRTATSTVRVVSNAAELVISSSNVIKDGSDVPDPLEHVLSNGTKKSNEVAVEIGGTTTIYPFVNIGTKKLPQWEIAGDTDKEGSFLADSVVSYTVKGKGIVSINQKTGEIRGMKDGKVTVTAKTATGASKKFTVVVELPSETPPAGQ